MCKLAVYKRQLRRDYTAAMTTAITAWTCPTCHSAHASGAYCAACGERRLTAHDQTLAGVLHEWFESLVHVDGRILRSCRELLLSPGSITAAYLAGRRQPYIGPFQLFLAINVVFFLTQSLTGLSILSLPLAVHLQQGYYGAWAQQLLDAHLLQHGLTQAAYAPEFDRHGPAVAKSMVILMVPMLACVLAIVFYRRRRTLPTHLRFSVHFYAAMLLFLTLLFPLVALVLLALRAIGLHAAWSTADGLISTLEFAAVFWYFLRAIPRVYPGSTWRRVAATIVLPVAVIALLYFYRVLQFVLTLFLT